MAKVKVVSVQMFLAPIPADTAMEQLVLVPHVKPGDFISVNKPSFQPGLEINGARAAAPGQIGISLTNETAAPLQPVLGEFWTVLVVTPDGCCDDDDDDCCDDD
jgi:hypothetical protein